MPEVAFMQPPTPDLEVAAIRDRLDPAAVRLLDALDSRHSEWATACSLVTYAMNAGITEDQFVAVASASDFAFYFASESGRDRSYRLESRLRKAWAKVDPRWIPPVGSVEQVRERLEELSHRIVDRLWKGGTASTDLIVAIALVVWAHEVGVWTLDASERELALRAGMSRKTASGAMKRLEAMGFMSKDTGQGKDRDYRRTHAQRWVLDLRWGLTARSSPHDSVLGGKGLCGLAVAVIHPAFLPSALGRPAGRVWFFTVEHPGSTSVQIAEGTGVPERTVRNSLKRLEANSLVKVAGVLPAEGKRKKPSAVYEVDPAGSLWDVAEAYGTADWWDKAADRVKREREARQESFWQNWVPAQNEKTAQRKAEAEALKGQARKVLEPVESSPPEWVASDPTPVAPKENQSLKGVRDAMREWDRTNRCNRVDPVRSGSVSLARFREQGWVDPFSLIDKEDQQAL